MSLKINPIFPKQKPSTNYKPKITPKIADKTKQTNQAINRLAVRFSGEDETKPAKKTVNDFYQKVLKEQPLNEKDKEKKIKISINLSKNATLEDYRLATDKMILQKAGYSMLNKEEVAMARDLIGLKDNFNLKNLKDLDKANKLVVTTNQYFVEKAKVAGQAVLQFREYESKKLDAAIQHGKNYATDALGGFVQPIVNAPINIINGVSEPFRAGEKMLFGTQNIPVIPRMEVAERSEYWNKDGRMLANKGAEIGATIIFGGGAGAKALATKGGRALLGLEASYNIASGGYGKDVNQTDANGNPRQMDYFERGGRVFGGVFGARQVVKAEVTTPNSIVNNLDDIFKPKPPQPEAITPEGFRVKVPQTENVKGANVLESRAYPKYPDLQLPVNKGRWQDEPGNSGWVSNKPPVNKITKGEPVPFKDGFVDFSKWSKGNVTLSKVTGDNAIDFPAANKLFAQQKGWLKKNGTPNAAESERYRIINKLTWHHVPNSNRLELIPRSLHGKIPHTGSASQNR